MRKLYIWWQGARKYAMLDLFLLFTIAVALYSLSNALGTYRMLVLEEGLVDNAIENEKSVYYMEYKSFDEYIKKTSAEVRALNDEWYEDIEEIRNNECVEEVHNYYYTAVSDPDKERHNISAYSKDSVVLFPELYRGSWPQSPIDEDGCFNGVVYGGKYKDIELGTVITAYVGGQEIRFKICGAFYESLPIPQFNGGGSYCNTNMLYSNRGEGVIIFQCPEIMEYIRGGNEWGYMLQSERFVVEFRENASVSDMDTVLDKLSKRGGVSYIEDILTNTAELSDGIFKSKMTVPIFYTVIAGCAFFCITILYVIKRTKELSVYHLLGYSKFRMAVSIVSRIVLLISVAAAMNIAYVENYYLLLAKNIITADVRAAYFDDTSSIVIIAICGIMLAVAVVAALCTLYSRAPIALQRASKE